MTQVLQRLKNLGHDLPAPPKPAANYVPWSRLGRTIHVSGQIPVVDGRPVRTGCVGREVNLEDAKAVAGVCARNVLAVLDDAARANGRTLDDLRLVRISVFVASADGFSDQHVVANGASDLLAEVLGENGVHARSAVGVARLPLDVPVEVEAIAELPEGTGGALRAGL